MFLPRFLYGVWGLNSGEGKANILQTSYLFHSPLLSLNYVVQEYLSSFPPLSPSQLKSKDLKIHLTQTSEGSPSPQGANLIFEACLRRGLSRDS